MKHPRPTPATSPRTGPAGDAAARRRVGAVAAALGLALLGVLLTTGCSGRDGAASGSPAAGTTVVGSGKATPVAGGSPIGSASAGSGGQPTASGVSTARPVPPAPPVPGGAAFTPGRGLTVPSRHVPTVVASGFERPHRVSGEVTVRVGAVRALVMQGRGVGEISGPALAVTLQVDNRGKGVIPLDNAVVTAAYGPAKTPASFFSGAPSTAERPVVPAGGRGQFTVVFAVPPAHRDDVALTVGYAPGAPVLTVSGDLSQAGR